MVYLKVIVSQFLSQENKLSHDVFIWIISETNSTSDKSDDKKVIIPRTVLMKTGRLIDKTIGKVCVSIQLS